MSFNQIECELEEIHTKNELESDQIYDKELESLMSELNHPNLQASFTENPLELNPLQAEESDEE